MLELITKLPVNVIGVKASGQVTANDYQTVLIPIIEARLKLHPKIRILFHLGTDFTDFSLGAMWTDAKIGVDHFKAWEMIAIVTDEAWVTSASDIFNFAIPCPLLVFSNDQYTEAEIWLTT
tara:strand:+ start:5348 stop:5710 length:363 start_codon:yes stop_codon:yes gene_type:complete